MTTQRAEDEALDPATRDILLRELRPVAPPAGRVDAIRARILARIAAGDSRLPAFVTVREPEGKWIEVAPKVKTKELFNDGRRRVYLVRMEPGAAMPGHNHEGNEECMVLQGEIWLGELLIRAGDFHRAPRELPHGDVSTDTGVLLYVSTELAAGAP